MRKNITRDIINSFVDYGMMILAVIFYFVGIHNLFFYLGIIVAGLFILIEIIALFMVHEWIIHLKFLSDVAVSTLLGCMITDWNVVDGFLLGLCILSLLSWYMNAFEKWDKVKKESKKSEILSTKDSSQYIDDTNNPEEDKEENDAEDEDADEEEEDINHIATRTEMKDEAIRRMKHIGVYGPIIDDFINNDNPQVYEYPNGASYALEDEEMEHIVDWESKHCCLVWGVSRSEHKISGKICKMDNMFFVSNNKEYWDDEREQLYSGMPLIYAYNYEFPDLSEMGCISIFMSSGGTPLRQ